MAMKVRVILSSVLVLAAMSLASCGHYTCGATFGSSTCTPAGGGVSQGGGTTTGDAFVYVADAGGIQGETFDAGAGTITNIPNPVTGIDPNASNYWMVIAQKQYLYVGYPGLGQIYAYSISSDGSQTAIAGSPFSVSFLIGSTIGGSQAMIANPAGTLLFVMEQSANAVYVYTIGAGGVLTQAGSPLVLSFLPLNLAVDGLGKYLYVTSASLDTSVLPQIGAYSIGSDGSLTVVPNSPFISNGLNLNFAVAQMQGDPSGKYMIGTTSSITSSDPHLYVLSIASDGELSPVAGSPFPTTSSPSFVTVQPSTGGTLVYSITVNSSDVGGFVEGYQLDPTTGILTADSGSPFGITGDYAQFDQAGTYLFVRDLFNKDLSIYTVGTAGTLTNPTASVGWGPGSWAPTDVP